MSNIPLRDMTALEQRKLVDTNNAIQDLQYDLWLQSATLQVSIPELLNGVGERMKRG